MYTAKNNLLILRFYKIKIPLLRKIFCPTSKKNILPYEEKILPNLRFIFLVD